MSQYLKSLYVFCFPLEVYIDTMKHETTGETEKKKMHLLPV